MRPLCRFHDVVAHSQPQAHTLAVLFGGQERLEKLRQHVAREFPRRRPELGLSIPCVSWHRRVLSHRFPPWGMASLAFITRARRTCSICAGSHCTRAGPLARSSVQLNSVHLQLMRISRTQRFDHGIQIRGLNVHRSMCARRSADS